MKKYNKEALFEDFAKTVHEVSSDFILNFFPPKNLDLVKNITGVDWQSSVDKENLETVKNHVRNRTGWDHLSYLYDFAIEGYGDSSLFPEPIEDAQEIISHLDTSQCSISKLWSEIITMADARYRLDRGWDASIDGIALLANVDIRTVRNAISADELNANKQNSIVYVNNQSARNWLNGRRGFVPTKDANFGNYHPSEENITRVYTFSQFGGNLSDRHKFLGIDTDDKKLKEFHPSLNAARINEIESGVFELPLDAVIPLADLYQFDRHDFLTTVMKLFFNDEFLMLTEKSAVKEKDATND